MISPDSRPNRSMRKSGRIGGAAAAIAILISSCGANNLPDQEPQGAPYYYPHSPNGKIFSYCSQIVLEAVPSSDPQQIAFTLTPKLKPPLQSKGVTVTGAIQQIDEPPKFKKSFDNAAPPVKQTIPNQNDKYAVALLIADGIGGEKPPLKSGESYLNACPSIGIVVVHNKIAAVNPADWR